MIAHRSRKGPGKTPKTIATPRYKVSEHNAWGFAPTPGSRFHYPESDWNGFCPDLMEEEGGTYFRRGIIASKREQTCFTVIYQPVTLGVFYA